MLRVSDGTPEGSTDPNLSARPKAIFPVTVGKGDDVTMPLREGKLSDYLNIKWAAGTDCNFEIQWTKGGGQFIPCFKGSAKGKGNKTYKFEEFEGSEVRVAITRGKAVIEGIDSIAIQK